VKDPDLIRLTIDVGEVSLSVDEAIPCGLIINELISNSLKHAFPDDRGGEITVTCRIGEDGRITLTVSDNGIGLPPGLDVENTETLGLQLVAMLVKQLHGRIELSGDHGTLWEIAFSSMDNGKSASA
jgi:two-component sensor histidine kinase